MNTLEAIKSRRAVKHFDANHKILDSEMETLLDAIRQAPTSFNIQNTRVVIIEDKLLRQNVKDAAWNQAQITDASLLIVICADLLAWKKSPERYWGNAPEEVRNILVPMIVPFYEGKEQLQRDEAMRSVGIAAQTIMLAAKDLGYDSCPMIGFDQTQVASIINLPADHVIGMIVTVGKALKPAHPKGGYIPNEEFFIRDAFV